MWIYFVFIFSAQEANITLVRKGKVREVSWCVYLNDAFQWIESPKKKNINELYHQVKLRSTSDKFLIYHPKYL